jgi:hypothetical protein
MKYQIKQKIEVIKEIEIKPCLFCGNSTFRVFDCGYTTFNVCGVECTTCKRTVSIIGDYSEEEVIERWNLVNGVLTDLQKLDILRKQIEQLGQKALV